MLQKNQFLRIPKVKTVHINQLFKLFVHFFKNFMQIFDMKKIVVYATSCKMMFFSTSRKLVKQDLQRIASIFIVIW